MSKRFPSIKIYGARQNNLKNLDLEIPLNRMTVVTGVSGSGKSSLAIDTLYAEGQRRYIETFSPYARQFMDRMDRPHADRIEDLKTDHFVGLEIERSDGMDHTGREVDTVFQFHVQLLNMTAGLGLNGEHTALCGAGSFETESSRIHPEFER